VSFGKSSKNQIRRRCRITNATVCGCDRRIDPLFLYQLRIRGKELSPRSQELVTECRVQKNADLNLSGYMNSECLLNCFSLKKLIAYRKFVEN